MRRRPGPNNPLTANSSGRESAVPAAFVAGLRFEDIPGAVVGRAVDFFVDWVGSALSGKDQRPIVAIARFAAEMGLAQGPCEILPTRGMITNADLISGHCYPAPGPLPA